MLLFYKLTENEKEKYQAASANHGKGALKSLSFF